MATSSTIRAAKTRKAMRASGLRPIQIWAPDTRTPEFKAEARRQSRLAARHPQEKGVMDWMESAVDAGASRTSVSRASFASRLSRGSLVTVASTGDSGEPAAALVIQPDFFTEVSTATVLLISSERVNSPLFRIDIAPTSENGLEKPSQIMIDKIFTVRRENLGRAIGRIGDDTLLAVNRALAVFLGLG